MEQCEICKEWIYSPSHKCPPKWKVWVEGEGDEDDNYPIYARATHEAAEKLAELWDEGNHNLMRGDSVIIVVMSSCGVKSKWSVIGEAIPNYYSTQIE